MPDWFWIVYFIMIGGIILEALLGFPFGRSRICFMLLPPFVKRFAWDGTHWYGFSKEWKFVWRKELQDTG